MRRRISRERIAWAVALLLFVVAGFTTAAFVRTSGESTQVVRASLLPPAGNTYRFGPFGGPLMISPDGTRIIFSATDEEGNEMLWVRPLDAGSGHPIPGTQGGVFPFWSPDSRWIGFFAVDELKKVDLSGTPPITLCSASNGRSGSWNKDGTIIFGVNPGGIMRVAQVGGEPLAVTVPDSTIGETTHRWPQFLPDGKHFLYFARKSQGSPDNAVWISSLDGGERELLIRGQSNAVYASGYMMFLRDGTLMAQPFNADSRKLEGEAFPIAEDIQYFAAWSRGTFAASETGVLVYQTGGGSAGSKLALMDREGNLLEKVGEDLVHRGPVISPSEEEIVVPIMDIGGAQSDLWIYEVARGLRTRFTFANATAMRSPVFSRDGKLVAYSATLDNSGSDLYIKSMYGSGEATLILETDVDKQPSDFSPDGKYLIYHHRGIENTWDVARIALESGAVPEDLIATPFFEDGAVISHDGNWIAYASTETGQYEVYVTRYPDLGRKWQISARGGDFPHWIKGGREIVYLSPDGMLHAVSVEASGDHFRVGEDKELFEINQNLIGVPYDVTESGDRFLTSDPDLKLSTGPATLVLNWDEELKNR